MNISPESIDLDPPLEGPNLKPLNLQSEDPFFKKNLTEAQKNIDNGDIKASELYFEKIKNYLKTIPINKLKKILGIISLLGIGTFGIIAFVVVINLINEELENRK